LCAPYPRCCLDSLDCFLLLAPLKPSVLVRLRLLEDEKEAQIEILKRSSEVAVDEGYVSEPRNIVFETSLPGGEKAIARKCIQAKL